LFGPHGGAAKTQVFAGNCAVQPGRPFLSSLAETQNRNGVDPQDQSAEGVEIMSIGLILVILLVIFLLGGFSGRFGGYGYGYGNGGVGVLGTILIIVVVLMLLGKI
jgi:Protein of unknown function (DUF3309)